MKLQAPTSKLQRNAKQQATAVKRSGFEYPVSNAHSWSVEENCDATPRHPFDLEERTAIFGESVIRFLKKVPRGPNNDWLMDQLTGCGTSIGQITARPMKGSRRRIFEILSVDAGKSQRSPSSSSV